jgi:hypothetical protein
VAMVSQGDNKVCYHINDKKYSHSYFSLFVI